MRNQARHERVVHNEWVTETLICDLCGAKCQDPKTGQWSHNGVYDGSTDMRLNKWVDGVPQGIECDLCPSCMEELVIVASNTLNPKHDDLVNLVKEARRLRNDAGKQDEAINGFLRDLRGDP